MKREYVRQCLVRGRQMLRDRNGNVTMTFALALIPLIGAIGSAVDYSRANSARTAMQASLDAAGLALSKEAQSLTQAQLEAKAIALFKANYNRPETKDVTVTSVFSTPQAGSFQLNISASGKIDTTFTAMWQPDMSISAKSQIVWGMKRLELVLALDNTGSMSSSNKMTQLKLAAKDLLKTLQNAAKKPDDIKVGIVPFATDVNVGTSNKNAAWIRWDEWEATNGTCSRTQYTTKTSCENAGRTWTPSSKNDWNGCVWDRDQSYDVNNSAASINLKATLYSAHQASNCPVSLITLTNDWSALNSKVDSMTPTGNTNVTIGLQMAFQMLSPVAPFNAAEPKADLEKVIILLTDGDNTENRWSTSQTSIDARTRLACTNVRAANIKVYTVRVINGNASLLEQCASKTDMYYNVQNASQLSAVFATIAQNLANLRLAK
ncbi:pilus assembly protein [Pseudorhodoplanes sp.]|uniref:vWA domain-containing protein n=1 Tax=Pseudorhodoplanes sp. TaxID=1934341 RepID=UPI002C350AFD|nr:pilus assembly protein [Pseudorhodoplanes sp.]HWV55594.1 pilus assembly protein [Pseudorhodoplanes sp.]